MNTMERLKSLKQEGLDLTVGANGKTIYVVPNAEDTGLELFAGTEAVAKLISLSADGGSIITESNPVYNPGRDIDLKINDTTIVGKATKSDSIIINGQIRFIGTNR